MFGTNALLDNFLLDAVPARHGKLFCEKGWTVGGQQRAHDMSQGTLKKNGNIKWKGHCAQRWTGNLEACADGAAEIVTRASSTSHDNPVAEFGWDCNLQLLRWDSKQATTCTMLASWCSLWLKLYSDFFGGDHAWKLSGTKVTVRFHREFEISARKIYFFNIRVQDLAELIAIFDWVRARRVDLTTFTFSCNFLFGRLLKR